MRRGGYSWEGGDLSWEDTGVKGWTEDRPVSECPGTAYSVRSQFPDSGHGLGIEMVCLTTERGGGFHLTSVPFC